jgi:uncharacterized protein YkwD
VQPLRRTRPAAATVVAVVALGALAFAQGAVGSSDSALIASAATCPGATSADATATEQRAALLCLINFARTVTGRGRVNASRTLTRAARTKGRDIAFCHDFDHWACGLPAFIHLKSSGFRFRTAGENLFAAERPIGTARDAFVAWLQSPTHRHLLFVRSFSHVGIALLRVDRLAESANVQLWVLELAQRA